MASGIFKGPKGALIFMGATMLSVAMLVGTEDDEGALVVAADELGRDRPAFESVVTDRNPQPAPVRGPARPRPVAPRIPTPTVFASEEELLDNATGFDPSPEPHQQFDTSPPSSDGVVVESYEQIQEVR